MVAVNPVGLDIGSTAIRAVETSRGRDRPIITRFGQVDLPAGVVQAGVITDPGAVTTALRHVWATTRFHTRDVVLGVTNPQVVVRAMEVANLPPRELKQSLPFQVRDALPLPVERSILDFYPLEVPGDAETVRGLLIAAPKEAVLIAVRAAEQAGLRVVRVDLASFALLRAVSHLDDQVEALVDIGAMATSVLIHADGEPLIVRTIPRGGMAVSEMIATRLAISVPEAETLKCRVGLDDEDDPDTAEVVREAVRPLINEIRSSFAYLTSGDRPVRVTRLVLSGGGSLLRGLVQAMSTQLAISTVLADPMSRLRPHRSKADPQRLGSTAAISIGLTMGASV